MMKAFICSLIGFPSLVRMFHSRELNNIILNTWKHFKNTFFQNSVFSVNYLNDVIHVISTKETFKFFQQRFFKQNVE